MGHRPTTSHIIEQTSSPLSEVLSGCFVGKVHIPGATRLGKATEEGLGTVELIKGEIPNSSGGYCN